jgi:phosphopantothenoylcysteine decarboxylase/phosphopantothenate--cysteine ligase
MSVLTGKRIVVGVTGGIAAYKSADLVRRLRKAGAEVRVVLTAGGARFITPLTLQAVSGQPVHERWLDAEAESGMGHIELARWADAVLVAPASANILARLAAGLADDLLTTLCLATNAPLAVAPAMNQQMWQHPATAANMKTLAERGVQVFGPAEGEQACGDVGPGRMLEPEELLDRLAGMFGAGALAGHTVLVTAGPTFEAMDPVRGISNPSSGKMGYALAAAAAEVGARVVLVSGPVALADPTGVETIRITSAQEMHDAVLAHLAGTDIFIGAAAVSDYAPVKRASRKLKKDAPTLTVELTRTPDILAAVAAGGQRPFTVGFAAETEDLEKNARAKLLRKGLDLIVANHVGVPDSGFGHDHNEAVLISRTGARPIPRMSKRELARLLIADIATRLHEKNPGKNTRSARRQ